jgi:hypothetical protein
VIHVTTNPGTPTTVIRGSVSAFINSFGGNISIHLPMQVLGDGHKIQFNDHRTALTPDCTALTPRAYTDAAGAPSEHDSLAAAVITAVDPQLWSDNVIERVDASGCSIHFTASPLFVYNARALRNLAADFAAAVSKRTSRPVELAVVISDQFTPVGTVTYDQSQ